MSHLPRRRQWAGAALAGAALAGAALSTAAAWTSTGAGDSGPTTLDGWLMKDSTPDKLVAQLNAEAMLKDITER